jgi:hypothetical protein
MGIDPVIGAYILGVVVGIVTWEMIYRVIKKYGNAN